MSQNKSLQHFKAALEIAAERYAGKLQAAESGAFSGVEARRLLARFSLPAALLDSPEPAIPHISETQRIAALRRVRSESRRLARLARVRHPAYDLNRHIALRRLLVALDGAATPAPIPPRQPPERGFSSTPILRTAERL